MSDPALIRIAAALERLAPAPAQAEADLARGGTFVWHPPAVDAPHGQLRPVEAPRRVPLDLLLGIDTAKARLMANVARFAGGLPANHALLWGVRGAGKSALVKAVHGEVAASHPGLALIEVARGDVATVPVLARRLPATARVILFIDDLSFDARDEGYKALKAVLDGGVDGSLAADTGRVMVVVTSNRRHLVARQEASEGTADLRPEETTEEQVSLSDRFGLWLGFHAMDQQTYLAIVQTYCVHLSLDPHDPELARAALQWAMMRGSRSGRTAWQFVVDRAGARGQAITFREQGGQP